MAPDSLPERPRLIAIKWYGTDTEHDWLRHAAHLKHMSLAEYVRRAINAQLRREGVDAVLLKESTDAD